MSLKALFLGNLGKGHVQNAVTKLIDVLLSTDAGQVLTYGTDNGLLYVPAGLTAQKTEFFASTSLVSNGAGWTKASKAKWITVLVVAGGASGSCSNNYNQISYGGGGEPGAVELYSGPASEFPASADVVIGAGGAAPTTAVSSNDGGTSSFGTLVRALGGRGYVSRLAAGNSYASSGALSWLRARCSWALGIPGHNYGGNATTGAFHPSATDSPFGPGAGSIQSGSVSGSAGGASSTNRPQSSVAGGAALASNAAAGTAGSNGSNAIAGDPWSFGSGGGAGTNAGTGGNGGIPGGGGAGSNNSSTSTTPSAYFVAPGSGARGEVRVISYW